MIVVSSVVSNRNIAHRLTKSASADLPPGVNARGLTRNQAAALYGLSLAGFDKAIATIRRIFPQYNQPIGLDDALAQVERWALLRGRALVSR
jgi:hypothetical protein